MNNLDETLSNHGIKLPRVQSGNQKIPCPKCSHTRTKNPSDAPLSIRIEADLTSAVWNCHHCGWKGGTHSTTNKRSLKNDFDEYPSPTQGKRAQRHNTAKAKRDALRPE